MSGGNRVKLKLNLSGVKRQLEISARVGELGIIPGSMGAKLFQRQWQGER